MDEKEITNDPSIDAATVIKIAEHYAHAKAKHPYFADRLFIDDNDAEEAKRDLESVRMLLHIERKQGKVYAETLADCEAAEVCDAIARGDKAEAIEEVYDCIAVLLRMVDVLEGRQDLGSRRKEARNDTATRMLDRGEQP